MSTFKFIVSNIDSSKAASFDHLDGVDCVERAVGAYAGEIYRSGALVPAVAFVECIDSENSQYNEYYIVPVIENRNPTFTAGRTIHSGTKAKLFFEELNKRKRREKPKGIKL